MARKFDEMGIRHYNALATSMSRVIVSGNRQSQQMIRWCPSKKTSVGGSNIDALHFSSFASQNITRKSNPERSGSRKADQSVEPCQMLAPVSELPLYLALSILRWVVFPGFHQSRRARRHAGLRGCFPARSWHQQYDAGQFRRNDHSF